VLVAFQIHAHRTENVMFREPLAINVNHQNLHLVPTPFLSCVSCSALAFMACWLAALRETPTVSAILGSTFVVFAR
jgi:hypothetical protein